MGGKAPLVPRRETKECASHCYKGDRLPGPFPYKLPEEEGGDEGGGRVLDAEKEGSRGRRGGLEAIKQEDWSEDAAH